MKKIEKIIVYGQGEHKFISSEKFLEVDKINELVDAVNEINLNRELNAQVLSFGMKPEPRNDSTCKHGISREQCYECANRPRKECKKCGKGHYIDEFGFCIEEKKCICEYIKKGYYVCPVHGGVHRFEEVSGNNTEHKPPFKRGLEGYTHCPMCGRDVIKQGGE